VEKLQRRIVGILKNPRAEWIAIAAEPDDVGSLYAKYIAVLAAIPAAAIFLGLATISISAGVATGVTTYLSGIVTPLVVALVIEKLAPRFQSSGNLVQALKLVAYSYTPIWLAGVLYAFGALTPLVAIAALYALYLCYLGLPPVMRTPPETVVPFMLVSVLAVVALNILVSFVVQAFSR
jgi:hypothetical protein